MSTFYIKEQNGLQSSFNTADLITKNSNSEVYSVKSLSNTEINSLYFKKISSKDENQTIKSKIEFMVNHQPQIKLSDGSRICWPLYCVYDVNESFVGYLMHPPLKGSLPLKKVLINEYPTNDEWHTFKEQSQASCDTRLNTVITISQVLRSIDEIRRYTFNYLIPMNFMITSDGKLSLIDCDSIIDRSDKLNQSIDFKHTITSGYTPPEQLGKNLHSHTKNEHQELFALAVIIYELMFRVHPYSATFKSPYSNLGSLDERVKNSLFVHGRGSEYVNYMPSEHEEFAHINHKLKSLFHLAFDISSKDRRPTPQLWQDTVTLLVNERSHGLKPIVKAEASQPKYEAGRQNTNSPSPISSSPILPAADNYNSSNSTNYNAKVNVNWWQRWEAKLAIASVILFISIVTVLSFTSRTEENFAEDIYDAQAELALKSAAIEVEQQNRDNLQSVPDTYTAYGAPFELTNQYLYVISDKANLRQRPSLNAPVVMQLDYNTKLNKTDAPTIEEDGVSWINVASSSGTRGWISDLILSKYPRDILYSRCGIRNNEIEYIVNSAGVNVRSQPNLNDSSVIGVIQQGQLVCPYMYANTSDRTVGRWMGFQLTNGNIAWAAESLLEQYYYEPEPEPEPEPVQDQEHLYNHEPDSLTDAEDDSDEDYYDGSWY